LRRTAILFPSVTHLDCSNTRPGPLNRVDLPNGQNQLA